MTTVFLDSVNHYSTADRLMKYSAEGLQAWSVAAFGRSGTNALSSPTGIDSFPTLLNSTFRLNLKANETFLSMGFAAKCTKMDTSFVTGGSCVPLVAFADNGSGHLTLMAGIDGSLIVILGFTYNPGATHIARSAPGIFINEIYQYIEIDFKIDNTTGFVKVYRNGVQIINVTNVDTQNGVNNYVNQVCFMQLNPNQDANQKLFCDIYIAEGGVVGDVGVFPLFPNGAGAHTQWTPSTAPNYSCVNEHTPDGDSSYVQDSTAGDRDTYTMDDLPAAATAVACVQEIFNARKTDASVRTVAPVIRSGGTDFDGTAQSLNSNYLYYWQDYDTDPNTSAAWTVANVNAVESGQKMVS